MARSDYVAFLTLLGPRELRRIAVALVVGALFILWIGRYSDIDLLLADTLFDTASNSFPWQHAWLTETFSHLILKWLLMLAALGFIGYAAIDAIWPLARFGALDRLRIRIVALSAILVPAVISSLKQVSSSHCPWDLARYGGDQPYVRIFDTLPIGAIPGHCLPAGHASSALWLLSLAVYWLPAQARAARTAASVGITFGALLGFLQQLRGAHFLTHTLWSIWIACAIVVFVIVALQRRKAGAGASLTPPLCPSGSRHMPEHETKISESIL
jgi:membrane-associated PAP2 superfamily phosphatase